MGTHRAQQGRLCSEGPRFDVGTPETRDAEISARNCENLRGKASAPERA
jgi:hypothetical protein